MKATKPKSLRKPITADTNKPRPQRKSAASDLAKHDGAQSKLATVVAMLRKSDGAGIEDVMRATGWQRHTVRGVISGAIKKRLGLEVGSATRDGKRVYRISARPLRGHGK
jgi:hypothetical protein